MRNGKDDEMRNEEGGRRKEKNDDYDEKNWGLR